MRRRRRIHHLTNRYVMVLRGSKILPLRTNAGGVTLFKAKTERAVGNKAKSNSMGMHRGVSVTRKLRHTKFGFMARN